MSKVSDAYRDGVPRSSCKWLTVPEALNKITDVVLNYRPKPKKKKLRKRKKAKQ